MQKRPPLEVPLRAETASFGGTAAIFFPCFFFEKTCAFFLSEEVCRASSPWGVLCAALPRELPLGSTLRGAPPKKKCVFFLSFFLKKTKQALLFVLSKFLTDPWSDKETQLNEKSRRPETASFGGTAASVSLFPCFRKNLCSGSFLSKFPTDFWSKRKETQLNEKVADQQLPPLEVPLRASLFSPVLVKTRALLRFE